MIQVEILKISYHPPSKGYAVILKEIEGDREIPVIVGSNEAQSIAMAIENIDMPRPLTHDLALQIINDLDADLTKVIISDMDKGTFYAKLILMTPSTGEISIDSRPSDAISLALRAMSRIYVNDMIFNSFSSKNADSNKFVTDKDHSDTAYDMIENLTIALSTAIEKEEYEMAARIRDRIKEIEKSS